MTIGEIIKNFRETHGKMSQSEFAKRSGISKGYISMLENNKNPQTGRPIHPTVAIVNKVSSATGIAINDLFSILDPSQLIDISNDDSLGENTDFFKESSLSESETELLSLYSQLNSLGQELLKERARSLLTEEKYTRNPSPAASDKSAG